MCLEGVSVTKEKLCFTSLFPNCHHEQDEKAHHQLEKKELEDKLNSEMEAKMEQQRKSASKRENLLQEELKALQVTLSLVTTTTKLQTASVNVCV